MNWDLFAAFLVITAVLIVVPGPIVTLIIATGARQGVRPALVTVAGTSVGNAILLAAIALGLGLGSAERGSAFCRTALGRRGLFDLARHSGLASCR